jgi:hypothetical protein
MRQPMRPFITAYKNRSSKSRTSRPSNIDDSQKAISRPLPLDLSANAASASGLDASCSEAWATADALFGGKGVEVVEPPKPHTRRILPCLLQPEAIASTEEETKKAQRAPRVVKQLGRAKATAIDHPSKAVLITKAVEPSPIVVSPDVANAPAARRERRPIQNRWVRKTELKPGEKWKSRLCDAAR